jgi:hypothetical protein
VARNGNQIKATQKALGNAGIMLGQSPAFLQLNETARTAILRDLDKIGHALAVQPMGDDPYAFPFETPNDLRRSRFGGPSPPQEEKPKDETPQPTSPKAATETIARRAGALSDEINFPDFVAGLIHGTFDAIVDANVRQMETFANLVSAVAKDVDRFTSENVTSNQVRDHLAQQFPAELRLDVPLGAGAGQPRLLVRGGGDDEEPPSPEWLADYGLEGQPLTEEVIEEQLVPAARRQLGESRLQMLAAMVLMGLNRIVVRDGSISARLRFRAVARDKADVQFATTQDPGGGSGWGMRGSSTYSTHATMVSTVGVNAQADSELRAELFGEVKLNFASETLPLDRFADAAKVALLQRNARYLQPPAAAPAPANTAAPPQTGSPVQAGPPVQTTPPVTAPAPGQTGGRPV